MDQHLEHLKLSIINARSDITNREFHWYGPWNTILNYWFTPESTVVPQYEISYELTNRDDKRIRRIIVPDFVVTQYYYDGNNIDDCVELIVENKRACEEKDLDQEFATHIEQLEDQITALFSQGGYKYMYSILAVGKYWRWYKYKYVKTSTHIRKWSDQSYKDVEPIKNYKNIICSDVLDISSNSYYSDFRHLKRLIR